jgi:phosphate transport system substrate-binding protein
MGTAFSPGSTGSTGTAATLQLTGSTTLLPRMQRAAEAYMGLHPARIVINGGCGTTRGYKALLDGTTHVAMASSKAPGDMTAVAAARGLAFRETVVARDAILALVHASNPLTMASLRDLRNIFTGRIANWRQLGGIDAPIDVLVGPPAGGVSASWRGMVLGADDTLLPSARVLPMAERIARVAAQPYAITYVAQTTVDTRRLKVLRVEDTTPGAAAAYPLHAPMMLVTLGTVAPAAAQFIAFAAATGAAIAEEQHE